MITESEGGSKRYLLTLGGGGAEAAHISSSLPGNIGVFLAGNLSSGFVQMNASTMVIENTKHIMQVIC